MKLDTHFQSISWIQVSCRNVSMVFCWGMNFCYPVFQVLLESVWMNWNESCWSVTRSTMVSQCPVSSVLFDAMHAGPARTQHACCRLATSIHSWSPPQPWGGQSDLNHILQRRKLRPESSGESPRVHRQGICWFQLPYWVFVVNFSTCMTLNSYLQVFF